MSYDENSIKVYKGLDGIRAKPTMYIGELGSSASLHLIKEVVENSIDEYESKNNNRIVIEIKNKKITIIDEGRGIPVGKHKSTGISTLQTILTTTHSGGKFDDKSYKTSRGTHGLGIAVVNALSSKFMISTFRSKKWYTQKYEKGKPKTKLINKKLPLVDKYKIKKGTIISFIIESNVTKNKKLKVKDLISWLNNVANLNSKLKIELNYNGKTKTFLNKKGPKEFLKKIINGNSTIGKPFIFESENLNIAIQWTDYNDFDLISFVSGSETLNGGTHVKGLTNSINQAFRKVSLKKHKYLAPDLKLGLMGFINYKMSEPEFGGQTKNELVTKAVEADVKDQCYKLLLEFLQNNKKLATTVLEKATKLKTGREKLQKLVDKASKVNNNNKALLPGKLNTCHKSTNPKDRELFITEGDSAAGSAKAARDPIYQEVLRLKGKPVNVVKKKLDKVLTNAEVLNILTAIGWTKKDIKEFAKGGNPKIKLRTGKIFITADADVDGIHIESLVLSIFNMFNPELFEQNKIHVVRTPLFMATYKNKKWFSDSKDKIQKKAHSKAKITRLKGLGEVNWEDLKIFAFDTKTRKTICIKPLKSSDRKNYIKVVGEDTTYRKKILGIT